MQESLKLIYEIITSYVEQEREGIDLGEEQQALSIIDVFSGQMTDPVIEKLKESNIKLTMVPANMTNLFQPLDLTVNGSAKAFLKKKFTEQYSSLNFYASRRKKVDRRYRCRAKAIYPETSTYQVDQ